jgi:hypothetical protein
MELNMCLRDFKRNKDHNDYGKLPKYVSLRYFTLLQQLMNLVCARWELFDDCKCDIGMGVREIVEFRTTVVTICATWFNIKKLLILPIYKFRMILTVNSDCFPKQHEPAGLCSGDVISFLWGTNWVHIYIAFCQQSVFMCSLWFSQ